MKRLAPSHILGMIALLLLPFVYNSCQGGFLAAKGKSGNNSSTSCKVAMEKGMPMKVIVDNDAPPSAFAQRKVMLKNDMDANTDALSKADGAIEIAAGTELGVIMNNECIQGIRNDLDSTIITKSAIESGGMYPELKRQAYLWKLDRAYEDSEIEEIASNEACVIGIAWNKEYTTQAAFNDSNYMYQTHFGAVKAEAAYPKIYNDQGGMGSSGSSTVIAVMDTGVDWTHPDLQNNIWAHQYGMGIDITTLPAFNTGPVNYNPADISPIGHGTHVAGLIGAISNNSLGTVGLMPKRAKIMAIKVFKMNSSNALVTSSQYFYNGVQYAYLNGASVINISLAEIKNGSNSDSLANSAFEEAVNNGMTVVTVIGNASSGNGALVNGTTLSSMPGQYATRAGVIGVGSTDAATGDKSYFSHYSTTYAEISAPGAESGSTGLISTTPVALNSYGRLAGTSQAAPLVAAAAGMVVGMIKEAYNISPTPAETERLIMAAAAKVDKLKPYFKDGNALDLSRLADIVNRDYPLTKSSNSVDLSGGCP